MIPAIMETRGAKPKLIVIGGPTGIGKTGVAVNLAHDFKGEIISADSVQLYRHMTIGTAKPTPEELAAAPHHLIDAVDPDEPFDAARFKETAGEIIARLIDTGKTPFVVGGTGLYIKALVHGLSRARPAHPETLARLKDEAARLGSEVLHRRLAECDAVAAQKIHPNDTFRIVRALEIYEQTGNPISAYHSEHGFAERAYQVLKLGLDMERPMLYERINRRVDIMLGEGLLEEVKGLLARGYHPGLKAMQSIGYRHMTEYLAGKMDWDKTVETLKRDTRRYAKRQLTWFRADPEMQWFRPDQTAGMRDVITAFLK